MTRPHPISTARSSRNAWPSSPAVLPSSRSALPPRSNSKRRRTASRTLCRPPAPLSKRASFPVADLQSCEPALRWTDWDSQATRRPAPRFSGRPCSVPSSSSLRTRAYPAKSSSPRASRVRATGATTPRPPSSATCSRRASWTRRKSPRAAIENASSVAAMVLTTESLITDVPVPESAAPAMPPMDY